MKVQPNDPPRTFETGRGEPITIKDCGRVALAADELVTFVTESGAQYDVVRKNWGFYATPSVNGRLLNQGLRAVLVRNNVAKYYVFLLERGHEAELERYLALEQNTIVRWLDNDADLNALSAAGAPAGNSVAPAASIHCPCGGDRFVTVHMYWQRPQGETPYQIAGDYKRELFQCALCGHFVSVHAMQLGAEFYKQEYVSTTYGDDDGLSRAFRRIIALPPERSDNRHRVDRIHHRFGGQPGRVLDVGSGLCVFLFGMKQLGWSCTALDPDPRAARHAREVVGVDVIQGDFHQAQMGTYDLITFNKVLEHVRDPIAMLARAREHLAPGGQVYVELPDGEAAASAGFDREEFYIEHLHVFSAASLARLVERAGFRLLALERIREPSTKFTVFAYATPLT